MSIDKRIAEGEIVIDCPTDSCDGVVKFDIIDASIEGQPYCDCCNAHYSAPGMTLSVGGLVITKEAGHF